MRTTRHIQQRMSQRGVNQDMVDLVLEYGAQEQDRYVIGRKTALELLETRKTEARLLMKILDKGGVVVVAEGDALITTYNYCGRRN